MLSSAYKKFASEKGLKISKGICYGDLNGFIVTLSEGSGYKEMYISASIDEEAVQRINAESESFKKNYKLSVFEVNSKFIHIGFVDSIGTIKRIESFTNEVIPMFKEYGAKGSDTCPECQNSLDSGAVTKLIYGHAIKLHSSCAEEIINGMQEEEQVLSETKSNAGLGIVGAVLFGIIGAIPWAIVYAMGWFVAWLGAFIGFMVVKGYEVFKGNIKKSVIPIFAVIVIVCVVFAQFLGDAFDLGYEMIKEKEAFEAVGLGFSDIPSIIIDLLKTESKYQAEVVKNILIGIIFAGLGVYGIFRSLISRVSSQSKKVIDLE